MSSEQDSGYEGEAYGYLSRLLVSQAPQCKPLPDLMGVCTQIDNLLQSKPAPVDAMREALHPIKFSAERWEDDEWIVTADGEPCGCTVTKSEANAIVRWVGSAWAELFKANAARTALAAAKSAKLGGES